MTDDRIARQRATEEGANEVIRSKRSIQGDIHATKAEILDAIHLANWGSTSTSWESRSSETMTPTDWRNSFKNYVLSSLGYEIMTERLEDIPEAHKRDRKSTRLNSSHPVSSRMPSSA